MKLFNFVLYTSVFRSNFLTEAPGQYTGQVQMAGGVPGRAGPTMVPGQMPQQGGRTSKYQLSLVPFQFNYFAAGTAILTLEGCTLHICQTPDKIVEISVCVR